MLVVIGGDRAEGDARHAVDRRLQLVVGDAGEHALDDDVRDRQQAAGLDAAERADVKSAAASISTASTPRFDQRSYWPSSGL